MHVVTQVPVYPFAETVMQIWTESVSTLGGTEQVVTVNGQHIQSLFPCLLPLSSGAGTT